MERSRPGVYNSHVSGPRLLDLNAEIDRLYQAPLAEFTAARNALATRIKAEQGKDAAQHVKTLEKPNATAWLVNQLVWRHRSDFTALLLAGDAVRLVQQQRLGGAGVDVAPAIRSRQAAMDVLLAHAADLIREMGQTPSPEIRQRLVSTLDALATYGTAEGPQRAGRLTRDVDPPGFGALAALLPAAPPPGADAPSGAGPSSRTPPPKLTVVARRGRERAQAKVAGAEAALDSAKARDAEARDALAAADSAWQAARKAVADQQQALDRAAAEEAKSVAERDERKRDATRAAIDVRDAERALEAARRALQD
jgi:hypothetical protein